MVRIFACMAVTAVLASAFAPALYTYGALM